MVFEMHHADAILQIMTEYIYCAHTHKQIMSVGLPGILKELSLSSPRSPILSFPQLNLSDTRSFFAYQAYKYHLFQGGNCVPRDSSHGYVAIFVSCQ